MWSSECRTISTAPIEIVVTTSASMMRRPRKSRCSLPPATARWWRPLRNSSSGDADGQQLEHDAEHESAARRPAGATPGPSPGGAAAAWRTPPRTSRSRTCRRARCSATSDPCARTRSGRDSAAAAATVTTSASRPNTNALLDDAEDMVDPAHRLRQRAVVGKCRRRGRERERAGGAGAPGRCAAASAARRHRSARRLTSAGRCVGVGAAVPVAGAAALRRIALRAVTVG